MRALILPIALFLVLLLLASLGSLLLVSLAYGLAGLLGRWILLGRVELTALSFAGLLASIWFIVRAVGAGLVAGLSTPVGDDDEDPWFLGPYEEDDEDEVETRRGPPPRAHRRKDERRK